MEHDGPAIGNLVFVAILAFAVPLLLNRFRRVRIPIAAGEILAGILVGKSGLGLIHPDPLLDIFNFLGLASLMFLSGMEIDPASLVGRSEPPAGRPAWLSRLYNPLALGMAIFGLSTLAAYQFTLMLAGRGLVDEPLFLTMIIATCGVTIILPVLKDRELLTKPFGQVLFNTAILGDILPLLGLSVLVALRVKGSAIDALWILALIVAGAVAYFLGRFLLRFNLLEGLFHGTAQISVRAAFALMFVFLALAESVGVETILGAFIAGLLLSALAGHQREEISHKLDALGFGFLIPVFFLMVGIEFDLRSLLRDPEALTLVPVLLAGVLLVKAIPAGLLWIWYPLRQTLSGMVLLTTQMSVTIAASSIAHKVGAYGPSVHAAVVLVAILTAIIGPVAFNKVLGEEPQMPRERKGVVLAGMNRLALLVGSRLAAKGVQVTAVDQHPQRVKEFMDAGIPGILARPAAAEGLEQAGASRVQALLAVTEDEEMNLAAARVGKNRFGIPRAILFARTAAIGAQARKDGFEVINPDLAEAILVENLLQSPAATALLTDTESGHQLSDLRLLGGPLIGKSLREAHLPPQILVVSILRGHERIVPHGNTVLQTGDVLTIVGPAGAHEQMVQSIRSS